MMKNMLVIVILLAAADVAGSAHATCIAGDKALQLFNTGQYGTALPYLEKCASSNPSAAFYYMLGYSYYELNDYKRAVEYFDQAFLIDPDFSPGSLKTGISPNESDIRLIDELLEISGARGHLKSYSSALSRGIPVIHSRMKTGSYMTEIQKIIKNSFDVNEMLRSIRVSYAAGFRKDYAVAALEWLKTDAGKRLAANGLYLGGRDKEHSLFLSGVRDHAGMDLAIKLERAMRYTETVSEIISISMFGMMKGIQSELQEQSRLDSDEIDLLMPDIRKYAKEELEPDIMLGLLEICRDLTDEEIRYAIRFYSSPEGAWLTELKINPFSRALGSAAKDLGVRIGRSVASRDIPL